MNASPSDAGVRLPNSPACRPAGTWEGSPSSRADVHFRATWWCFASAGSLQGNELPTASEENREENETISLIGDIMGNSYLCRVLPPRGIGREIPGPVGHAVLGLMRHFKKIVFGGADWLMECGLTASSDNL